MSAEEFKDYPDIKNQTKFTDFGYGSTDIDFTLYGIKNIDLVKEFF